MTDASHASARCISSPQASSELAREIVYGTPLCEVMALMTALDHWDAMLHAERMAELPAVKS